MLTITCYSKSASVHEDLPHAPINIELLLVVGNKLQSNGYQAQRAR